MTETLAAQLAQISNTRIGLYSVVTLLTCLSPGPKVLLMISTGLRAGARAALTVVAGIMLVTRKPIARPLHLVYALASILLSIASTIFAINSFN